uniref:Endonuclease/exonuclease/phosphatase domain-containing protein n=1 Tax=Graphocephala atropunctata TaxID=36148 RepID=A0A1B6KKL2_9HEMI
MPVENDGDDYDDGDSLFVNLCSVLSSTNQFTNFFNTSRNNVSLNIFHCNIRSYTKNFDELLVFLDSIKRRLDVIVLTECWLKEGGVVGAHIDDFDTHWTDKQRNQNDGVIVFVRKHLLATAKQVTLGDVYGIALEITLWKKHFNILAIYRTINSNAELFIEQLHDYYDRLEKNKMCIYLGDINLDLLKNDALTDLYKNCLGGAGLVQCIDKPTRITENSKSSIDHMFVRYNDMTDVNAAILETNITDHYSTALTITSPATTATDNDTPPAPHTFTDHALLTDTLAKSDWEAVLNCYDANICANTMCDYIQNSISTAKKIAHHDCTRWRKLKPWITSDLIRAIRVRDKLSKASKKQPFNPTIREKYREHRQNLSRLLSQTKRNYYRTKIDQSGKNPKVLWGIIKELSGRVDKKLGFPILKHVPNISSVNNDTYKNVANDFNTFFASIGQKLADGA